MWNGWCSPIICKFSTCLSIWGFLYLPWSSDVDGHPWIKKGLIYPLYGIPIPNDGGMTIYPIYKVLTMDNLGIKTICFLFKSDHIRAFDLFFWTLNFDPHPHLIDQITTSLRISQCHRNDAWSGVTIPKQPDFRFVIYYNLPIMMIMIPLDHDDSDHSDSDGNHKHHHHHHQHQHQHQHHQQQQQLQLLADCSSRIQRPQAPATEDLMRACEQSSQLACWKHQGMDETYVGGLLAFGTSSHLFLGAHSCKPCWQGRSRGLIHGQIVTGSVCMAICLLDGTHGNFDLSSTLLALLSVLLSHPKVHFRIKIQLVDGRLAEAERSNDWRTDREIDIQTHKLQGKPAKDLATNWYWPKKDCQIFSVLVHFGGLIVLTHTQMEVS